MSYGTDKLKMGILDFYVKLDLKGQGRSLHKTLTFGSKLAILALTGPSNRADRQVIDAKTDTHRRRHGQYPKAKTCLG